jgi:hypothetical protein
VTALYPDGHPRTNFDLDVSIYLWDQNHCGVQEGLPLGNSRTDAKGTIEVLAPLVPLYRDGLEYYAIGGTGPAGPAYSSNIGMKIPADEAVVVKVAWEVPEFAVQLRVLTPTGRPRQMWTFMETGAPTPVEVRTVLPRRIPREPYGSTWTRHSPR